VIRTGTVPPPFPAIVTMPDGTTITGAKIHHHDGQLRIFTVQNGKVHLAHQAHVGGLEAPTRQTREWITESVPDGGRYGIRRGGCP
jgi:hypothetical protein